MTIEYTYEIISVDENARCMVVVYSSEGHQTMQIGARLPFEDESIESIIKMYAPLNYWKEQKKSVFVPVVGLTGAFIDEDEVSDNINANEVEL
jgi:hypothetical protein